MSNLSRAAQPKEPVHSDTGSTSSGTMLMTMLLLIVGLLLTSTMMLNYSAPNISAEGHTAFDLSATLKKAKTYTALLKNSEESPTIQSAEMVDPKRPKTTTRFGNQTGKVRWPKLKLTGFGRSADGKGGFAILNGEPVYLGQYVDGKAKLVQIRPHDVVVEYRGETKTLTMNTY